MSSRRRVQQLWLLMVVALAAVAGVLFVSGVGRVGPETRVRDFDYPTAVSVAVDAAISPAQVGFLRPQPTDVVSVTGVATNTDPEKGPVTPARARELAEALGYAKTNLRSHGQPVYKKGR